MSRRRSTALALAMITVAAAVLAACTSGSGSSSLTGTASPGTASPGTASPASSKPNVVFVLTDDLSWNLIKYLPHVQQMQKDGVTFPNYITVDSLCCPSRSSIFTGKYPHDTGVFTNTGSDGGFDTYNKHGNPPQSYGVAMQKAGYRTGFMGKYLNGYEPDADHNYVAPGWNEWDAVGNGYKEFNYGLNENGTVHQYGKDPSDYLTDVLSSKATSFIHSSATQHKPFALEVATFAPHKPSTPAPRDAKSYPNLKAPHGPAYNTLPRNAPKWLAQFPPLTTKSDRSIDRQFRKRAQSLLAVDAMIGHIEQQLKTDGQTKNTYLVFSSDNGFHMGDYRLHPGKQTAFDTDVRVPLMVVGPGVPAGRQMPQVAQSVDLAPTFESIAGASTPGTVDGRSMLDMWHGKAISNWPNAALVEHHGADFANSDPDKQTKASGNPPTYEAIRTSSALYVEYADGEREYYDLRNDPNELNNLAGSASAGTLAPLQKSLAALRACHGGTACAAALALAH